jgi:hypothetical protein
MADTQVDKENRKLLIEIREDLLSPRARKLQSMNFSLSVWVGVFVGLAASAFVSSVTIFFQLAGKIENNVSFAANLVMFAVCAVLSSSLYKRYKLLNEVKDEGEVRYRLLTTLRPYDFLKKLLSLLKDSELKMLGHSFELSSEVQEMKGVKGGTLRIRRADYILLDKTVARVILSGSELTVKYALDVEGETALDIVNSKLREMEKDKSIALEFKMTE